MINGLRPGPPGLMRTVIAVLSVVSLGGDAGAQAPADNWAQFRGNARLTGLAAR